MRDVLSNLIVKAARDDDDFVMLSGDHGYALFDAIREQRPSQFINIGVAEQNMIGVAAGLAKVGYRPCVYGLSAFIPMRVLEQIKLDLCHSRLPVILLGDGAGLVYSTLGVSHQCGEDVACLRPLPEIAIYSPCDATELAACWHEARAAHQPSYIRLGKADRPAVHEQAICGTEPVYTHSPANGRADIVIIATGSMVSPCVAFAMENAIPCISIPRIKPLSKELLRMLEPASRIVVVEEHCKSGGLWTSILELMATHKGRGILPKHIETLALEPAFTQTAGSWQQAMYEHQLNDDQLRRRLLAFVKEC